MKKKLTLNREVIRSLSASAMHNVLGGTGYGGTHSVNTCLIGCATTYNTQPTGNGSTCNNCGGATYACGGCQNQTATCAGNYTCGYANTCGGYASLTC